MVLVIRADPGDELMLKLSTDNDWSTAILSY